VHQETLFFDRFMRCGVTAPANIQLMALQCPGAAFNNLRVLSNSMLQLLGLI